LKADSVLLLQEVRPSKRPVYPNCGKQFGIPKPLRVDGEIPETDPMNAGETIDNSLVVGASGTELLLEVLVEGESHQFLIDSGASLSLVKIGVG
jgi:hypothetical protein